MELTEDQLDAIKSLLFSADRVSNAAFSIKTYKGVTTIEYNENAVSNLRIAREILRHKLDI